MEMKPGSCGAWARSEGSQDRYVAVFPASVSLCLSSPQPESAGRTEQKVLSSAVSTFFTVGKMTLGVI